MGESGQSTSYKANGVSPSRGRATDSTISARHKCGMQTSSRRIPLDESSLLRGTLRSDVLERSKLNDIRIHPRCMRVINLVMPIDTVSGSQRDRGHIQG